MKQNCYRFLPNIKKRIKPKTGIIIKNNIIKKSPKDNVFLNDSTISPSLDDFIILITNITTIIIIAIKNMRIAIFRPLFIFYHHFLTYNTNFIKKEEICTHDFWLEKTSNHSLYKSQFSERIAGAVAYTKIQTTVPPANSIASNNPFIGGGAGSGPAINIANSSPIPRISAYAEYFAICGITLSNIPRYIPSNISKIAAATNPPIDNGFKNGCIIQTHPLSPPIGTLKDVVSLKNNLLKDNSNNSQKNLKDVKSYPSNSVFLSCLILSGDSIDPSHPFANAYAFCSIFPQERSNILTKCSMDESYSNPLVNKTGFSYLNISIYIYLDIRQNIKLLIYRMEVISSRVLFKPFTNFVNIEIASLPVTYVTSWRVAQIFLSQATPSIPSRRYVIAKF